MKEPGESPELKLLRKQMEAAKAAFERQYGASFAAQIDTAQKAVEQMQNSSAFLKLDDLVKQFESSTDLARISDLQEQLRAMRPESLDVLLRGFSDLYSRYSLPVVEHIEQLNAQLDQMHLDQVFDFDGGAAGYRIPEPSSSLAWWLHEDHPVDDVAGVMLPEAEEVETFWLALTLVACQLLAVFAMAAKTGNWETAEAVLSMLASVATIYAGTDLLVKKVMK